ncbi:esterase/lipase family protein [Actinokineospora xionganensis]|uniref:Lipase n=1 Tax=Actinokineospora xionganensis TaxID=2684470 RepID=A0ABR7LFX0_9PSEU|nr:lipase [Actinokineospora xionganensis]MBC6451251.1 lipase [Actinokineospora xionganensis]
MRAILAVTALVAVLTPVRTAAADPLYLTKEATFTTVANGWEKVDRYRDGTAGFVDEQYPPDGRGDQDGQRKTFFGGVAWPSSSRFLLYSAPGWSTGAKTTPVLLVHGANDNPDRAWANPNESGGFGCGSMTCPSTGMMQHLRAQGHRVFAIGFAHKQGDNRQHAQQVGDAIAVIKSRLGVAKVDVVGWSKGMMSARMYVSSVRPSWGRVYAGDVRRLVTLGGPNGGYDYPFAHGWAHDFSIWPECGGKVNAPSPHTRMTCYGQYTYHPELSITPTAGWDAYPGQRQMLKRWDGAYGVNTSTQDWYTTYYGGQGVYTAGPGIQAAVDAGSLIAAIQDSPTPSAVPVYLLAGGAANIAGIWNETRGPSDGVVFIASALDTTGVTTVGATTTVSSANHLQLGWASATMSQVATWLS